MSKLRTQQPAKPATKAPTNKGPGQIKQPARPKPAAPKPAAPQVSPIPAGLTEFLLARIAEREQRAAAAPGPNWQSVIERSGSPGHWHGIAAHLVCLPGRDRFDSLSVGEEVLRSERPARSAAVEHAVGNDPAYVLADCAAKRQIIASFTAPEDHRSDAELHRARVHPDWEYATTEGQRKTWDDQDRPPAGDGWILNAEAGIDGWERFDYTEESYWRRPRTAPRPPRTEPAVLRMLALPDAHHPHYRPEWVL